MTLFRLDASIRADGSASRELADVVESEWRRRHPEEDIVRREIGTRPLPSDAWGLAVSTLGTDPAALSPAQRDARDLATSLVDELHSADALLLAVPLYNFGVSQHIKSWIDLVSTDPRAMGDTGLVAGKPTVLVTVRGGAYGPGTPREGWDHSTGYLRRILADQWGADLTLVEREFTLAGVNPALDEFRDLAGRLHTDALDAARIAAKSLDPAA